MLWAPGPQEVTLQVSEMFYFKILYLENICSHDKSAKDGTAILSLCRLTIIYVTIFGELLLPPN